MKIAVSTAVVIVAVVSTNSILLMAQFKPGLRLKFEFTWSSQQVGACH